MTCVEFYSVSSTCFPIDPLITVLVCAENLVVFHWSSDFKLKYAEYKTKTSMRHQQFLKKQLRIRL